MPRIRDYTQATSLAPTDAFVIDRVGVGTLYVDASALTSGATLPPRVVEIQVTDLINPLVVANGQAYFRVPAEFTGMSLIAVAAAVIAASSAGAPTLQFTRLRAGASVAMLSVALTIDPGALDSATAATPAVINPASAAVQTADQIRVDVTGAGTGAVGLIVTLSFQ
jgi:hypothetical protein